MYEIRLKAMECTAIATLLTTALSLLSCSSISFASQESLTNTIVAAGHKLQPILDSVLVSRSQKHTQQTPLANYQRVVYLATVDPGDLGDIDDVGLNTKVRRGERDEKGHWQWTATIIDSDTMFSPWHTAPSVGIDRQGYVHLAYNMHNTPWQYSISHQPNTIDSFEFRGQSVTRQQLEHQKHHNQTNYPSAGTASIPGNQVSYPAFFHDREQNLYISYRFAAKPQLAFEQRTMSAGIARYDEDSRQWSAVGGTQDSNEPGGGITAFASESGWTAYHPRLTFDENNQMQVNWFWRKGTAGETLVRPCFLRQSIGGDFVNELGISMTLPATPENCGNMGMLDNQEFFSIGNSVSDSVGTTHVLLSPTDGSERLVYSLTNGQWRYQAAPGNATELFVDANDNLWAVANGLRLYKLPSKHQGDGDNARPHIEQQVWQPVQDVSLGEFCYFRTSLNTQKTIAYIYAAQCTVPKVSVYELHLTGSENRAVQ